MGALACWLEYNKVVRETRDFCQQQKQRPLRPPEMARVRKWLTNAWSTEYFLSSTTELLDDDAKTYSVHWAFPQAYYSVYALRMAYTTILGYGDDKHQTVIRRFGDDANNCRLPLSLAISVTGIDGQFEHNGFPAGKFNSNTGLIRTNVDSVTGYVGSALRGTRRGDLDRLRQDMKREFKTSKGTYRKNLRRDDWLRVADCLGPTSIMSYMYRKRLKANYDDVNMFYHQVVDAPLLLQDISNIVKAVAFVHEALILVHVGLKMYKVLLHDAPYQIRSHCESSLSDVYDSLTL